MARPENGPLEPDPYQLLGVARQATPAEITRAWRRRARVQHPDARPGDAGAPARFRALAGAYELLSDPGHRAAYDQGARVPEPGPRIPRPPAGTAVRVTVLSPSGPPPAPVSAEPGAVLWAGPVRVEPSGPPPGRGAARDERAQRLLLAGLAARYLSDVRERPW
ncbi:MAG TPA: J domain-containing protein [Trebonia sp.]